MADPGGRIEEVFLDRLGVEFVVADRPLPETLHLVLAVLRIAAGIGRFFADLSGKVPDLEYDATEFKVAPCHRD